MTVLPLLQCVEAISCCRDREHLPRALLHAVGGLFGRQADVGILCREPRGKPVLRLYSGATAQQRSLELWLDVLKDVRADGAVATRTVGDRSCGAVLLQPSELGSEQMVLAFALDHAPLYEHVEGVASLARIYGHQIRLLDYSELDTLTRLLNRKSFDETFDRLLTASELDCPDATGERRNVPENAPAWLCVVDIDHFKRVNDSFGHLLGDEVLLRMGELMRKTFRGGDRLFRFGGEEFVVILNATDEARAAQSFNRFRRSVESHEFPQVGKVTCSMGFTAVSNRDVPTDVVGRADEALYYAKEHGRNRVCCYENLVADGAISRAPVGETTVAGGLDIDALFA